MNQTSRVYKQNQSYWLSFLNGDDTAFVHLYTLNVDAMLNYGLHFTSMRDQVKDAIQDVFVAIYSKRNKLRTVENVRIYLLVSLKNNLFAFYNKDMKHYQLDTMEPVFNFELSAEEAYIVDEQEKETKRKIQQMLNTLSPRQREVIYYRFTEGLSFEEICELMKMNVQSVRNLLHRTIKKIRELYTQENYTTIHY